MHNQTGFDAHVVVLLRHSHSPEFIFFTTVGDLALTFWAGSYKPESRAKFHYFRNQPWTCLYRAKHTKYIPTRHILSFKLESIVCWSLWLACAASCRPATSWIKMNYSFSGYPGYTTSDHYGDCKCALYAPYVLLHYIFSTSNKGFVCTRDIQTNLSCSSRGLKHSFIGNIDQREFPRILTNYARVMEINTIAQTLPHDQFQNIEHFPGMPENAKNFLQLFTESNYCLASHILNDQHCCSNGQSLTRNHRPSSFLLSKLTWLHH